LTDIATGVLPFPAETPDSSSNNSRDSRSAPTNNFLDYFEVRYSDPPDPGYTRSPALLHQLKLLKKDSSVDYVLIAPWPDPDYGVASPSLLDRVIFKSSLAGAIRQHSPRDVHVMYKLLSPIAESMPNVGKEGLRQQLKREYGIDVEAETVVSDSDLAEARRLIARDMKNMMGLK